MNRSSIASTFALLIVATTGVSTVRAQAYAAGSPPSVVAAPAQPPPVIDGLQEGISPGRYVAGGIVGTAVGFGIGHAISGEWTSTGWIFTVGEVAALTGAFGLSYVVAQEDKGAGVLVFVGGMLIAIGLNIWEIIDIWTRPTIRSRASARTGPGAIARGPVIVPYLASKQGGVQLGMEW